MENKKVKILALDDEKIVLESVSRILEEENYQVKTCRNGQEALETLKEGGFDILMTALKDARNGRSAGYGINAGN